MRKITISYNALAQIAHSLAGCLAVLGTQAVIGPRAAWPAAGAMVIFAAVKEFYWDVQHESAQTAGSGEVDFAFYCLGIAAGIGFHYLARVI